MADSTPEEPSRPTARGGFARAFAVCAALLSIPSGDIVAHEVPANVAVQIYARPQGSALRLLIRVPMAAMRDLTSR